MCSLPPPWFRTDSKAWSMLLDKPGRAASKASISTAHRSGFSVPRPPVETRLVAAGAAATAAAAQVCKECLTRLASWCGFKSGSAVERASKAQQWKTNEGAAKPACRAAGCRTAAGRAAEKSKPQRTNVKLWFGFIASCACRARKRPAGQPAAGRAAQEQTSQAALKAEQCSAGAGCSCAGE